MSRSNPTELNANPANVFLEWKGDPSKAGIFYFDKSKGEKGERVEMSLPFQFLVLDQLNTVTGYNEKLRKGIYANEVKDINDTLVVKFFNGDEIASGDWKSIKERVNYKDGAFAKSVYIAYKDGAELKIGNISMSGCSLGPWLEFTKAIGKDINTKAVVVKAGELQKTGRVEFVPPVFETMDVSEATNAKALELDTKLQEFLKGYFAKTLKVSGSDTLPGEENHSQERPSKPGDFDQRPNGPAVPDGDEDDIPFAPNYL